MKDVNPSHVGVTGVAEGRQAALGRERLFLTL